MLNQLIFFSRFYAFIAVIFMLGSCHTLKPSEKLPSPKLAANTVKTAYHKPVGRPSNSAYNEDVQAYIRLYSPFAIQEMKKYGVPASIIIAQGIHESRAGKSVLATIANNHFGIKCTNEWSGDTFHMDDDSPNECFRKYNNPESSFNDHMLFLQRKHYSSLFLLSNTDYKGWASGLKRCGYATNPRYAEILVSIIERYQLDRFDMGSFDARSESIVGKQVTPNTTHQAGIEVNKAKLSTNFPIEKAAGNLPPPSSTEVRDGNSSAAVVTKSADHKTFIVTDTIRRKVYITDTVYQYAYQKAISQARANKISDSSVPKSTVLAKPRPLHIESDQTKAQPIKNEIDRPETYRVQKGDTLYGICRRLKLNIDEVQKLNNLSDTGIKLDQVLKIPANNP